jgi:hypothetical protein
MKPADQQRIAEWIGDAFAIFCVRQGGASVADKNVRLGFEALLRHLGTPPLQLRAKTPPLPDDVSASSTDLRHIIKALDACLAVFERHDSALTTAQRRMQSLVRSTRRHADEELHGRRTIIPARARGHQAENAQGAACALNHPTHFPSAIL